MVSVIIPVFNGAEYLKETVVSALNSAYPRFEILLIDDGSKDTSKIICKQLAKQYGKVRYYSFARNKGLGRVLNFAIKKARGEYICRINQDDRMYRFRLKTQVDFLKENRDVVAVGSYVKQFTPEGKTRIITYLEKDEDIKKLWHIVSPFADPSVMYKKSAVLKAGLYDQSFWPADDTQLWYRMGMVGKLANIPKPLVEVRWHDNAASVKYFKKLALSTLKMHLWADENIEKVSLTIKAYWLIQFVAGMLLSPQMNWYVYRILKRVLHVLYISQRFLEATMNKIKMLVRVIPQPRKFSFSGS
ncbi:hypothetical protein A3F34_00580 [Candidatus Roizmanbacteria bacterium RIFCSPHIGHO2_12_FULL_44_10]|uniref:Glycosyltransferase 2-like domain-containing protein n=1 Tax=Candidatus Roizmanbacteria bacterium RIFCSPHIGHO2_12_FULL_44_10 TaxID=1802054 RepID=A0A1F7I6Y4_9BACT|nr:MAG: hypothetical protein A3F34_00580 [Candidatus Roizmanbacteria bacterium RIFCSPHIGHO2_12_FULL_44_10]